MYLLHSAITNWGFRSNTCLGLLILKKNKVIANVLLLIYVFTLTDREQKVTKSA